MTHFGTRVVTGEHDLNAGALFSDATLVQLLDAYPREHLYVHAFSDDETAPGWQNVNYRDADGATLLRAAYDGRLWINIKHVHQHSDALAPLISGLYRALARQIPGFSPFGVTGTLLISSPRARVYYHADAPCVVLWHLRGEKRAWMYPPSEPFLPRDQLEKIFTREAHEGLPYQDNFDANATIVDLQPGQFVSWPQNAPHRIENGDSLNVSLTTEYETFESRRKQHVYAANRWFRTRFGQRQLAYQLWGWRPWLKVQTYRAARRAGGAPVRFKQHIYTAELAPSAPEGWVPLRMPDAAR